MYDILIAGGGAAGLCAAVYSARAMLSYVVCDSGAGGAAVSAERIDNYLGMFGNNETATEQTAELNSIGSPSASPELNARSVIERKETAMKQRAKRNAGGGSPHGFELYEKFREHAELFGAEILTRGITRIETVPNGFLTRFTDGGEMLSKTVIYALGSTPRKLGAEGENLQGVSYCASCDGAFYKNKVVAVIGGGDTALSEALYLSRTAARVYLIHRRGEFRAAPSLTAQVKATANIELVLNASLVKILGKNTVSGVELSINGKGEKLITDGVFAAIGSVPNTDAVKDIVSLDERGYIIADESGKTSLAGFFAAGDVRTKPFRQIITACADGAYCVRSAEDYLNFR